MRYLRSSTVAVIVWLPFLLSASPAPVSERPASDDLSRETMQEDTSPRFLVTELWVSGNTLISKADLLQNIPKIYETSEQMKDQVVVTAYDFRVFSDLIQHPGVEYEISLKSIQGFTKYLLSVYQERGYAGIYVYVPADTVEQGVRLVDKRLHVAILEGKLAKLEVRRYDFDRNAKASGPLKEFLIKSWSPVKQGDVINKHRLDDYLNRLNLNPDRYVSAAISKSEEPNAFNLSYDVFESSPWHAYIQTDNGGTDDRKWAPRIGMVNTNLRGLDDRFSVMAQAPWQKGIEDEYSVFGSYNTPVLTDRLRLNLYGGRSEFDVPGLSGINFLGNGSFYGSGLNYTLFQVGKWFFDITGVLSREQSTVTPSFGTQSDVDMDLWGSGFAIHRSDAMSVTSLAYTRIESMGGSGDADYQLARQGANPEFVIHSVLISHSQYLDAGKRQRFKGSLRSRDPDERMVPAKMMSFGGLYSVRGYEENEIVADGGHIMSGQYEYNLIEPPMHEQADTPERRASKQSFKKLAPLVFVDYGRSFIKDAQPGEKDVQRLCSLGTGLLVEWGDNVSADIYYGWPLRDTTETARGHGRFSFSVICRF